MNTYDDYHLYLRKRDQRFNVVCLIAAAAIAVFAVALADLPGEKA